VSSECWAAGLKVGGGVRMAPTHAVLAEVDKTGHLGARCPSVLNFQLWRCRYCSPSIEARMGFLCHKRIGPANWEINL
jgi:hypothetical protein